MRKFMTVLLILSALLMVACDQVVKEGSGTVATEERELRSAVDGIEVCCGIELHLSQGEQPLMRLEAEDNLLEEILDKQSGSALTIEYRDRIGTMYRPTVPVKVFITIPDIASVTVSGGGRLEAQEIESNNLAISLSGGSVGQIDSATAADISVKVSGGGTFESDSLVVDTANFDLSGGSNVGVDALLADEVDFSVSGGGRVDGQKILAKTMILGLSGGSEAQLIQFTGDNLETDISGGGRADIAGDVDTHRLDLSGGSRFSGNDLLSRSTEIHGNGDAVVWATESLNADLSGGATVEYFGNPQVESKLSGGSEVKPLGGR